MIDVGPPRDASLKRPASVPRCHVYPRTPSRQAVIVFLFAYDGSINGDWVSHYAVQLAAGHDDPTLTAVHVRDGRTKDTMLAEKLQRMRQECEHHGVQLVVHLLPPVGRHPLDAIRSAVPEGPEHYLVCGTRAQGRGRGFLSGTTSEQLLRSATATSLPCVSSSPVCWGRHGGSCSRSPNAPAGFVRPSLPLRDRRRSSRGVRGAP